MQSNRSSPMAAAALMAMAAGFPSSHVQIAPAPRAVSREEQRKPQRYHDKHGKRRLFNARQQRCSHHCRHRQEQRNLHFCE